MTIDRTKLKRLAEAATPGPWSANVIGGIVHYRLPSFDCAEIANTMHSPNPISDAAFIGFSDPPTVLALLERITSLEHALTAALRGWQAKEENPAMIERLFAVLNEER